MTTTTNKGYKVCGCCHRLLPVTEYYWRNSEHTTLMSYCKECHKAYTTARIPTKRNTRRKHDTTCINCANYPCFAGQDKGEWCDFAVEGCRSFHKKTKQ